MNQLSPTEIGNAGARSCLKHKHPMTKTIRHRRGPEQKIAYRWVCGKCDYAKRKARGQFDKDYEPLKRKRERGKERALSTSKREHYKRKYGISLDELNDIWIQQDCKYNICEKDLPDPTADRVRHREGTFHLDHCHQTGEIRGLLCNRCNMGIGLLDDDISRLEAAIRHLNAATVGAAARAAA